MGKPFEIRKEIPVDATLEQVWEAIATGPGLTAWFMPMEIDPDSSMVTSWEPGRRLGAPHLCGLDGWQPVERVVQLDGVEQRGVVREPRALRDLLGVHDAAPVLVDPAGAADASRRDPHTHGTSVRT